MSKTVKMMTHDKILIKKKLLIKKLTLHGERVRTFKH